MIGLLDIGLLFGLLTAAAALCRRKESRLLGALVAVKLVIILFFILMIDAPQLRAFIVRLNVDQSWYRATADIIAAAVADRGFLLNYPALAGNQNFLYNMLLGLYVWGNGSVYDVSYILLNHCIYLLILYYAVRLRFALTGHDNSRYFAAVLFLLPTLNIYSFLMLRDLLIAILVCGFFYYLVMKRRISMLAVLVLVYFIRNQFAFILAAAAMMYFYDENRKTVPLPLRLSISGLAITAFVFATLDSRYGYLYGYVHPQFFLNFLSWLPFGYLGLDFIIQDSGLRAASLSSLLLYRIISPETLLLPVCFFISLFIKGRSILHVRFSLVICAALLLYCFGYFVEYRFMFVRLFIPFYPVFFAAAYDPVLTMLSKLHIRYARMRVRRTA